MSSALALVRELVARKSVSPADDGCQELLARRLRASGFSAERFDRKDVSNLWLRRGTGRPTFVFAGHTDVVPPGPPERWTSDPFAPAVRDGFLFGRGTADMKSSIAAFVVAAEEFVTRFPAHGGSIALLLTSDEEGPAVDGTVAVVEALKARSEALDFCLVGEPTCVQRLGDTVKNGRRGSLSGHLVVRGIQGHVAYPHLARNPVHQLAPALDELTSTQWDDGDANFLPTTFQISNIRAGTGVGNVIPGHCELDFNLRYAPASSPESIRQRIESVLFSHELEFELRWTHGAKPFQCRPGKLIEALGDAVHDELGIRPARSTTGGTSDGRFLAEICPELVEFGPPNGTIHMIDECIRVADIESLKNVYHRLLARLLPTESGTGGTRPSVRTP